jgi:Mn2+/Fe2+ NRAMP family transporter
MRVGLAVSILIGGLITAWILLAGTMVGNFSSFQELARSFELKMGAPGVWALATGLFAAGFSSAITSPYAASIIIQSTAKENKYAKIAWIFVLATGFLFGISGVKPIPVILLVQAINGLILPLITLFLILIVNDRKIVPDNYQHARAYNLFLLLIFGFVIFIGLNNVDKSISTFLHLETQHFLVSVVISLVAVAATFKILAKR